MVKELAKGGDYSLLEVLRDTSTVYFVYVVVEQICVPRHDYEDSECGSGPIDQIFMCLIHWRRAYQTHGTRIV